MKVDRIAGEPDAGVSRVWVCGGSGRVGTAVTRQPTPEMKKVRPGAIENTLVGIVTSRQARLSLFGVYQIPILL